jgi:PPP family 3-phenylpropionic acid transporter
VKDTSIQVKCALTAKYAGIQGMYFGALVPITAFASVFLLYRGFTNSQIGTLIALGSIGSVILQLAIGYLADKSRIFSIRAMTSAFSTVLIVLSLVLCILPFEMRMTAIIFMAILVVTFAMTPLISSMNFLFQNRGITVNYGVARAAGSIMYAILSAVIGRVVTRFSAAVIPWFNVLTFAGMLFFVAGYRFSGDVSGAMSPHSDTAVTAKTKVQALGMTDFIRRNRSFLVFLAGVSMVHLSNAATQTYLLQIITPKGGDSASLGISVSIGAALEVPMMVGFAWLNRKVKCGTLIQISVLFFTLKSIGLLLVPNVTGVYLVQSLNMFGYAMFTPASVYYVAQIMGEGDKVKGQAYLGSAIAISGICTNFAGGRILDVYGPGTMMQCVIALSIAGNAIVIPVIRAMRKKEDRYEQ